MTHTTESLFPRSDALVLVGGGNIARCLIVGLLARGHAADAIHVAEPHEPFRAALANDFAVHVHADNAKAGAQGTTWLFAVKPQQMRAACTAMTGVAQQNRPLVVSIAAGITCTQLQRWLGGGLSLVRGMPNTPAQLGAAATALYANELVSPAQRQQADALLQAVGTTTWIGDEALMDAVTALSGSGPAYVFLLAEAMQAAGVARGLSEDTARALTLQTLIGAARMLNESGEPAAVLRQRVTSAGGTTQAAMDVFEAGGFHALFDRAIAAATRRGGELSAATE
jgi:pyrroline-5-carboxylate reductase